MSRLTPKTKQAARARRHRRIRATLMGSALRPRLALFRSNRALSVQLIDDDRRVTLASARGTDAGIVGKDIAMRAKKQGITKVVFDRGGFEYTGSVKILADAARDEGLLF